MKKRLLISLFAAAFTLSMAMAAGANTDINVYGASAQFNFWSAQAQAWLDSPNGGGCTGGTFASKSFTPTDGAPAGVLYHGAKYFMAQDTVCANDPAGAGGTITIRVSAFDSYDGLNSVLGNQDSFVPDVSSQAATIAAGGVPGGPCTGSQRTMLNVTSAPTFPVNFACEPVNLGATDVTPDLFTQHASGNHIDGPGSANNHWNINLNSLPLDPTGLNQYQPVVVPFALFVNKGITTATCSGGAIVLNIPPNTGSPCTANAQCTNGGTCGAAAPIQSMSLDMITQLYTQKVKNWNQFGSAFPNQNVTLCLRVPGSGTAAAFDYSIMHRTGTTLPNLEVTAGAPQVYFNFTTGDMMNCINNTPGAIGYADADQNLSALPNVNGPLIYAGWSPRGRPSGTACTTFTLSKTSGRTRLM